LQGIVVVVDRTSRRKSGKGIHVRRFLQIVSIPVGQGNLIVRSNAVIQAYRSLIFPRVERKDSTLGFKLV
jgi:serine/threonine protein kinase HipA of HipAB toxin-antitoxin module